MATFHTISSEDLAEFKVALDPKGIRAVVTCWSSAVKSSFFPGSFGFGENLFRITQIRVWDYDKDFMGKRIERQRSPENHNPTGFCKFYRLDATIDLYQTTTKIDMYQEEEWYTEHAVTYVGNTSYVVSSIVKKHREGVVLLSGISYNVRMNLDCRTPDPIPEELRKLIEDANHTQHRPVLLARFQLPLGHLLVSEKKIISENLVDENEHTNMNAYVCLIVGSIREGILAGYFNKLDRKDCYCEETDLKIKSVEILYEGECILGDTVRIDFWEDADSEEAIFRAILSRDGHPLVCARVELF